MPPSRYGNTRHYHLARVLREAGHEVTIATSAFGHRTGIAVPVPEGKLAHRETIDGIEFVWIRSMAYRSNSPARLLNMITFAVNAVRELAEHADVVLGSSPQPFAALAASRLARRWRVPFVLEIRDLWPQTLIDLAGLSRANPLVMLLSALEKHLYRRASAIVTVLPGARDYIAGRGGKVDRIFWLPNGIILQPFIERQSSPGQPFQVMFAGAHGPANGLDIVLDAAKLLQSRADRAIRFQLVGEGPHKERLKARAAAEQIGNVVFEDPVPKAEVQRLMAGADAFLMTLADSPVFRWGISPNKLWDYMAAARPIVFSVSTPYNPVEECGGGVTVRPGDGAALADGILELARKTDEERQAMGRRVRAYVEENHDLTVIGGRLEELLRSLVVQP